MNEISLDATIEAIEKVQALECFAVNFPQVDCPVTHLFEPGVYIREIFMPANIIVTGAIHKHAHQNHLIQGKVVVFTRDESSTVTLEAPCSWVSQPCIKRAVLVLEDCIWRTVHDNPTNTTDLTVLARELTFSEEGTFLGQANNKQFLLSGRL